MNWLTFLMLLFLISIAPCVAQFSSYNSDQRIQSEVYVGGLSNIPPLHTDMSLDCLVGYIIMDSLSKSANIETVVNRPLTTSVDSLRVATRYMYSVADYSPQLLRKYITSTRDSIPGGRYMSFPANSYYGIQHAVQKRLNEFGKDYGMLLISHYVLKVRIDSVIRGYDTTYPMEPIHWTNVSCSVLNKLKGIYLPNNCRGDANRGDSEYIGAAIGENCLNFGYPTYWQTAIGFPDDRQIKSGSTIKDVHSGEFYYVFLVHLSLWRNSDYLVPVHQFEPTGGLFKISGDRIEDPSNFWGLGTNPSEQEFLSRLNELISNIKSWWL